MTFKRICSINNIITALQEKLVEAKQAHDDACDRHIKTYLPDYEAYPYRSEDGEPILQKPSIEEIEDMIAVRWPLIVQRLMPGLRGKAIVTGADTRSWNDSKMKPGLKRYAQQFAWQIMRKDSAACAQFAKDRVSAFQKASDAWFKINYGQPRSPYNIEALHDVLKKMKEFALENEWEDRDEIDLFLTREERNYLKQVLQDDTLEDLIGIQAFLPDTKDEQSHKKSLRAVFSRFAGLVPVSDQQLIDRMTTILSLDPASKFRLDFAQSKGVCIRLVQSACGMDKGIGGVIRGNDVNIFNVTKEDIGNDAIALDHELRHFWQNEIVGDIFDKHRSPVNRLVEVYLREADAYATCASSAYIWSHKGVDIAGWSKDNGFDEQYKRAMEELGDETKALNSLTSYIFNYYIFSGDFDGTYGRRWIEQYQPSAETLMHLSEMIACSPYLQEDFLKRLTSVEGQSYLVPEYIPFLQENIKNIGQSLFRNACPIFHAP